MRSDSRARTLHKVYRMRFTVGILAAALHLGCGVGGAEDVEGQLAAFGAVQYALAAGGDAAGSGQGADGSGEAADRRADSSGESGKTGATGSVHAGASEQKMAGGGTVASPQDPVPSFEGFQPPERGDVPPAPTDPRTAP
jgi:hypothetical protein